jgi:voltage-gated potassium channel Kch
MSTQALPRSLARWWWAAVTGAAVLTLALGPWGFWVYLTAAGQRPTPWDVVYRTVQLFALGGDSLTGAVPAPLQAARFLAAFVAFSTVTLALLQLFHDRLQLARLRFFNGHVVVCGLGRTGAALVEALRRRGEQVVVLEAGEAHEGVRLCRDVGALVLGGRDDGEWLLGRVRLDRARALLTLFQDDAANLRTALLARQLSAGRARGALKCVVQVSSRDLRDLLLKQDLLGRAEDPFQMELFNHYEVVAQAMLQHAPALHGGKGPRRLLIVGLGRLGEALLVRAARNWLVDGSAAGRRHVLVVDHEADRHEPRVRRHYPFLQQVCDLEFHALNVHGPQFAAGEFLPGGGEVPPVDIAFVCLTSEELDLLAAVRLSALLGKHRVPLVLRLDSTTGLGVLLGGRQVEGVRVVGLREVLANPALVLDATREALAQAIHEEYLRAETARGVAAGGSPSLAPWQDLAEDLKNSNREQAAHIPVKLRAAGCRLVPGDDAVTPFAFAPGEVETLARMEHDRWCDERRRSGWRRGPVKDFARKQHPSLVPWEELSEVDQDRDRNAVRHIPALATRAGFVIVREPAAPATPSAAGR